ncbi:MAG: alanine--glyoxylate aminotransferase family protein [Candidatus Eremiobacteraeota bacterium]|nr:alanine--glyoxylate aminotransferase family protein [Candidatus Eremiobacteraeota bacterium]
MHKNLLFLPGPVSVSDAVLAAASRPLIDHRGPEFAEVLSRVTARLQAIFGTTSHVALLGSSGTGGLEAAFVSLLSPGDRVLSCPVGVFGKRFAEIARCHGAQVEVLDTPTGEALDPLRLRARLQQDAGGEIAAILLTQNETSTGVQNDMTALARAIGDHAALTLVDAVSGMGGSEFRMDEWRFDAVVSASQKVFATPPGLAMVALSSRAVARTQSAGARHYYFDLAKSIEFARIGQTPWTPPVSLFFALDAALAQYQHEGGPAIWRRLRTYARAIRAAVEALELELFSQPGAHSDTVVAVRVPEGIDAAAMLKRLREERGIVLSGGQAELKGKIFRIGTMGELSQIDVLGMLGALEIALLEQGRSVKIGAGVQAALRVFLERDEDKLAKPTERAVAPA